MLGSCDSVRTINADRRLQQWRVKIVKRDDHPLYSTRDDWYPTVEADKLRSKWGKPAIGVSMAPRQHIISVIDEHIGIQFPYAVQNHFTYDRTNPILSLKIILIIGVWVVMNYFTDTS